MSRKQHENSEIHLHFIAHDDDDMTLMTYPKDSDTPIANSDHPIVKKIIEAKTKDPAAKHVIAYSPT